MALYPYGSTYKPARTGMSEFEILKSAHRFLRDEDEARNQSWDEQLASKYYASLYREFAVCDLKHYKSGNFALRWRTEGEVISGAGETTCGNTRCEHHHPLPEYLQRSAGPPPALTTMELPFAYEEHGENKSALVKVVLCPRCFDKLMWKRRKEKGKTVEQGTEQETEEAGTGSGISEDRQGKSNPVVKTEEVDVEISREERRHRRDRDDGERRRTSRSRSPRRGPHRHTSSSSHHRPSKRDYRPRRS